MSDIPPNTTGNSELSQPEQPAPPPAGPHAAAAEQAPAGSGRIWSPSGRLTAILAAAMLAIGVAVGAAIGPAPTASFAGSAELPLLLHSLIGSASTPKTTAPSAAQPAASAEAATPSKRHRRRRAAVAAAASEEAATPASTQEGSGSSTKSKGSSEGSTKPLAPVTRVWVVQLNGAGFEEALASPSAAPYIDSQAIPSGAFLHSWSSLAAQSFANDEALIATTEPQLAQSIIQPPCPEGAAGASCAAGTPGALSTADAFLKQTLSTITASGGYRSSGLVVVTFAAIANGASSELPAGSTTATLSSQPPAGALLISPFVTKGTRPSTSFDPSSPRQSLEALLHR